MSRDELAARLFVVMVQERDAAAWRGAACETGIARVRDGAKQAFDFADAFETERKRRLAQPAVVDTEGE